MSPRHPRAWLMTDERTGADALFAALERLPPGSGVIFRHYRAAGRRALYERVRGVARRRRLVLLLAGTPRDAVAWKAEGAHGRSAHRRAARPLIRTAPCHDRAALVAARRVGALPVISPIFATRSHPDARPLGIVRAGLMAGRDRIGLIALGGMDAARDRRVRALGFDGWAAIDAWTS